MVRWPGSETDNAASPAVEITLAVVDAVYSFATPGVNAPNVAGVPSVSASVAGTVPPALPSASVDQRRDRIAHAGDVEVVERDVEVGRGARRG